MKTLTVTLKQHTPLIHFQHDQYGATLRASEVKPKLDRFILTKLGGGNYNVGCSEAKEKGWLVGKGTHPALNYKVQIRAKSIDTSISLDEDKNTKINKRTGEYKEIYTTEDFPMLLSNMGGKETAQELVNFSYSSKDITLVITIVTKDISKDEELYNIVKQEIVYFIANTNFGQRSTKGFGSFTVAKIDDEEIPWDNNKVYENDTKVMRYEVPSKIGIEEIKNVFSVIDFYWKCLKSGINCTKRIDEGGRVVRKFPERYIKSFLWTYLDRKGKTWEKRTIKNTLHLECIRPSGETTSVNNKIAFFARAHLGCPINGFTYRIPQGRFETNYKGKRKEKTNTVEVSIKNTNDSLLQRISSPIIFKPVFHEKSGKDVVSVYILYDREQIEALYGATDTTFIFSAGKDSCKLPLFINDGNKRFMIDFHDLINEFHKYMNYSFIPRDFNWRNILGEKKVELKRTVKK